MPSSATSNTLTFTALWTPDSKQDSGLYVRRYRQFFESCIASARVDVSDPAEFCNGRYGDRIYQSVCTILLDCSMSAAKLEQLYFKLARQWCMDARVEGSPRLLQWLAPDRKDGFQRGSVTCERNIQLSFLSFGACVGLTSFAQCASICPGPSSSLGYKLVCVFKHDVRVIWIFLTLQHSHQCTNPDTTYKLEIPYENILRAVVDDREGNAAATDVYLHLSTFPLIYKKSEKTASQKQDEPSDPANTSNARNPEHFSYERAIEIGCFCTSVIPSSKLGTNFVLVLGLRNKFKARQILGRLSRRCDMGTIFAYTSVNVHEVGTKMEAMRKWYDTHITDWVGYECCYALYALMLQSSDLAAQLVLLSQHDLLESFSKTLREFASHNQALLEPALFAVSADIEARHIVTIPEAIEKAFRKMSQTFVPHAAPPGSCLVRRVFLLPSRLLLLPPCVHQENRVLRKFLPEFALRVTIRDDNLRPLSHSLAFHQHKNEIVEAIVGRALRRGIYIGRRQFKLLAASCSQLRDHGVWLFATVTRGQCPEGIREWMGDFSKITSIAKKMARMGQCFSSTEESVQVPLGIGAVTEADKVGGCHPKSKNPYVFSDGIGMVSRSLLQKVCQKLGIEDEPSAIQIRYAGYKGMLCLNPTLDGDKLVLRESMCKFPCSTSDVLEVIKVSAPRTVCLNRPLITILEQLGVPGHAFVNLQQNMVLQLADALVCEDVALDTLGSYVEVPFFFRELQSRGFLLTRHPFVRLLLCTVYKSAMDGLRTKTRIAVASGAGRNMLGVLDETGRLQYGQVFVQYTELGTDSKATHVLTGTVLVTKCPCLHPGDVRKFEAVDVPELRHIKDCIVFPAKGPRPHPNEMAGSDLDGDEYVVIWDKDLFFPGANRKPMTFRDHTVAGHSDDDLEEAMIQFICSYIKNDNIGVMANAHLAWADQLEDGIFSDCCLKIADKISVCLDFAKTGTSSHLDKKEKPPLYPDFMEKGCHKNTYQSKRILGQLYRLHRSLEAVVSTDFENHFIESDCQSKLFEFEGWQDYRESAERSLAEYASKMQRILSQHGIRSEGEVVAGLVNKVFDFNKTTHEKTNVETLVAKQYQHLVKETRQRFFDTVEAAYEDKAVTTDDQRKTVLLQVASAWYMVTYSAEAPNESRCCSFPWALADILLVLAQALSGDAKIPRTSPNFLLSKLNATFAEESTQASTKDLALEVITKWAVKDELVKDSKAKHSSICKSCLSKIFEDSVKATQQQESGSRDSEQTEGNAQCNGRMFTVGELVLGFLRHVSGARVQFPPCNECKWSLSMTRTITMAAVRTYSLLAITRDLCHLGLPCEPELHEPVQIVQEGNPVRIQAKHPEFMDLLRHSPEEVEELLRDWSGVQEVHIRGDMSHSGHYLLVSAVGRDWQRWFLEELVLQPWLGDAVVKKEIESFLEQ
ncbi:uncharacterized protein LOC119404960 [Rhipicephalus sanguineus]|uniref:RNA-dependent RNA polymerase n=1 Tax=Rhipicephalus sanguineus TaxID=34632 RepID=A0A9D4PAR8_RHISA|nr:uncharacterized protein LOC119404960 [Rhipicephalus sanguineus]KAH7934737.1 hypothetical protein HPB52_000027 [Rhipicephalus sanguineus]